MCRGLVELGGGSIALDSAPGQVTRIDVTLRGILCEQPPDTTRVHPVLERRGA